MALPEVPGLARACARTGTRSPDLTKPAWLEGVQAQKENAVHVCWPDARRALESDPWVGILTLTLAL